MTDLFELLKSAVEKNASDIFIVAGFPVAYKINGHIAPVDDERLTPAASSSIVEQIYQTAGRQIDRYLSAGDDDFAFYGRAAFPFPRQHLQATTRFVFGCHSHHFFWHTGLPRYAHTGRCDGSSQSQKGLVVVTGPAGGGKSTTLACIIDRINGTRNGHIITLEEPIEFLYKHKQSIISQREVELDTGSYVTALRACLRQAPDVILLGEMRDLETIRTAMTAAEMGHLIISTLHTVGAANTIDRIIDVFPPNQQQQIRIQLSMLFAVRCVSATHPHR